MIVLHGFAPHKKDGRAKRSPFEILCHRPVSPRQAPAIAVPGGMKLSLS